VAIFVAILIGDCRASRGNVREAFLLILSDSRGILVGCLGDGWFRLAVRPCGEVWWHVLVANVVAIVVKRRRGSVVAIVVAIVVACS
jgi:hypothetical protein